MSPEIPAGNKYGALLLTIKRFTMAARPARQRAVYLLGQTLRLSTGRCALIRSRGLPALRPGLRLGGWRSAASGIRDDTLGQIGEVWLRPIAEEAGLEKHPSRSVYFQIS